MEILNMLRDYLFKVVQQDGSDLHIKSNAAVRARVQGIVITLDENHMPAETVESIARKLCGDSFHELQENLEFDTVYVLNEEFRFRVNIFYHLDGLAIAMRLIPYDIKTMEELNLPYALKKLADLNRGLVLVTGTTGSGKSTTLATIIEAINKNQPKHIITIEDPVEFVHADKAAIIEQRGIGQHTTSFARALRAAMREDPDVIVVGEMRDVETAEAALQAVNSGHMVFSTLHTLDARETIDRLIAIFPTKEQNRIRMHLAANLQAVISQRLLRGRDDKLIPAVEMMFRSPRIEHLIRTQCDHELPDAMEEERNSFGSVTFNQALYDLVLQNKITEDEAYKYATSPSDLKLMLTKSEVYQEKRRRENHELDDAIGLKSEKTDQPISKIDEIL